MVLYKLVVNDMIVQRVKEKREREREREREKGRASGIGVVPRGALRKNYRTTDFA